MKKLISLLMAFAVALAFAVQPAFAAAQYKYQFQVVDQFGQPVTSGATVRVKTAGGSDADSSVWPTDDTTTGTLTGAVTPDSTTGAVVFYSNSASHDINVNYKGQSYRYLNATPSSDRRLMVHRDYPAATTTDDLSVIASAEDLDIPDAGSFFRVSGTNTVRRISATGSQAGREVKLLFEGAVSIGGKDGNILMSGVPSGGTLQVGAGTLLEFVYDGTNWHLSGVGATDLTW